MSSQGAYTYFGRDFPDQVITKPKIRLNYQSTSDLHTNATLIINTYFNVGPQLAFTVEDAASVIEIILNASGRIIHTAAGTYWGGLLLDGVTILPMGGGTLPPNGYTNPFAGAAPVYLSGLSAGVHTLQTRIYPTAAGTFNLQSGSFLDREVLKVTVVEHQRANAGGEFISTNPIIEDHISGLQMAWASPGTNHNNISVSPGSCYIPSEGKVIDSPSTITPPSSTTLTASTWYCLYGYNNGGVLALDPLSTTPPASSYKGTAKTKSGDSSRRFLGWAKTLASGAIASFYDVGNERTWLENITIAPFNVIAGGASTTNVPISCAPTIPPTSRVGNMNLINTAAVGANYVYVLNGDYNTTAGISTTANSGSVYPGPASMVRAVQLSTTQTFRYFVVGTGSLYAYVLGYIEER